MIQAHPYWESYDSVRAMITFIVIAPALVWFLGPVGILYALGVVVAVTLIYRLITACAGLLHPDVY